MFLFLDFVICHLPHIQVTNFLNDCIISRRRGHHILQKVWKGVGYEREYCKTECTIGNKGHKGP